MRSISQVPVRSGEGRVGKALQGGSGNRVMALAMLAAASLSAPVFVVAQATSNTQYGDVFDQFFRYAEPENKPSFQELPGETVDPFTGTLRISHQDFMLPGKAGLDLRIVRTYSSKIWGRADLLGLEPFLAEKENSVLGYGWTFHFGRLKNPNASGNFGICSGDFPVFESPDGTARTFYPVFNQAASQSSIPTAAYFVSKDYWRLEPSCAATGGQGTCVWSPSGVRYEFSNSWDNQYFVGVGPVWPASAVVDPFGNRISIKYTADPATCGPGAPIPNTGAPQSVTDTYGRVVCFTYNTTSVTNDLGSSFPSRDTYVATHAYEQRLVAFTFNRNTYRYQYAGCDSSQTGGTNQMPLSSLTGPRPFLSAVVPPSGSPYSYTYGCSVTVPQNQYALTGVTYPSGGQTTYTYGSVNFFTGRDVVPFPVVTHRNVGGRGVASGDWYYSYYSPTPGQTGLNALTGNPNNMHLTVITRPDGQQDTYTMYGFGWVADQHSFGYTYVVGLPSEVARANRTEVDVFGWDLRRDAPVSNAYYSAPAYSGNCPGPYYVTDAQVYAPAMKTRGVTRTERTPSGTVRVSLQTVYSNFDPYGQAQSVTETGYIGASQWTGAPPPQERTTTSSYFYAPSDPATGATLNIVRDRPLSQDVCIGSDCVHSAWTYDGPGYARDSETLSDVKTSFGYFFPGASEGGGNLKSVTRAVDQGTSLTLGLRGYSAGGGTPTDINFNGVFDVTRTTTPEGWVLSETNGRGYTTSRTYDASGRVLTETPPGNNYASVYNYTPNGLPDGQAVSVSRGSYWKLSTLDGLGRVIATKDSASVLMSTSYDNMGRASFQSYPFAPGGEVVGDKMEFDGLGRVVTLTKAWRPGAGRCDTPGACRVTTRYEGNCSSTSEERGTNVYPRLASDVTSSFRCDTWYGTPGERRPMQSVDPYGNVWQYAFTASGKLASVTAPLSQGNRSYVYDSRQFLQADTSGESGTTSYTRNLLGQPTSRTDARNVVTAYTYDRLGRLTNAVFQRGSPEDLAQTYDNANNVTHVGSTHGGTYDYVFDELNRVTQQTWTAPALPPGGASRLYTTSYKYDPMGCLTGVTHPTGTTLTMTCDTLNRVMSISNGSLPIVTAVSYHPSGQVQSITYGNGRTTNVVHDYRARPKSLTTAGVLGLTYGYDGASNVMSFCRDFGDSSCLLNGYGPRTARTMAYDDLDRLITSQAPWNWGTGVYDYDALGNRVLSSVGSTTTNATYDGQNRLSLAVGNEAFKPMAFAWDVAGRLASSSDGASYRYDGRGRRVLKTDPTQTTLYHHDAAGRVIAETAPDGTKLRDYIYLANKLVAVDGCISTNGPPCAEHQWYHTDSLGSVLARTDATGGTVAQLDYQPWGEPWSASSTGSQGDRQYNGRVSDGGTGFIDYGARLYWPQIGRFVSADSYLGDPANPASLNRFSYVHNNPYKYTDPTGHCPSCVLAIVGMIVGESWFGYESYKADPTAAHMTEDMLQGMALGGLAGATLGMGVEAAAGVAAAAVGGAAAATKVYDIPARLARVVPGDAALKTLGPPGRTDVFVTAAEDIAGMNASQIAERLTIPESQSFSVIEFATPAEGLASPVFRTDPGFVGRGLTAGGAREFVLPNGPIPADATRRVVGQ